ncbi:RNA polymerase sigma factor [Sphingomonas sp. OK281]|uniref:RNA polymerase sigma factor n=1 Tax=Sphingomonas sp. OK281 TaxID=1881067 RepID=UPI0008F079AF|nr:RNA polymerase sigma factor [Sphingomonas sp. OK281]SFN66897.1 RNA polymerase sigma-70 factor, ECF subfamily [Sphingomonas sp. OK281]
MAGYNDDAPPRLTSEGVHWPEMESLYQDHTDWLRRLIAGRLRLQPADVDDIVQDTWVRAARPGAPEITHPRAFLFQTALNLFRDAKRRETVRQQHSRTITADQGGGFGHGMSEQEATVELERIVLELPDKLRDVFVLSRFRHMTNAEIAVKLGISIKTVEWRMGKALSHCMSRLRD